MIYLVDLLFVGNYISVPFEGQMIYFLLCMVCGYLLGSINTAIIVSKKKYGKDIRNFGSGNAGLTNMKRVYGWGAAGYTLLGDVGKQIAAVAIGMFLGHVPGAYIAGLFCIIGHILPCWYGFKGGKGVLTAATLILLLDPMVFAILLIIWLAVLLLTRYVSLASIVAAFAYPAAIYARYQGKDPFSLIFAIVIGLFVIFMHRSNIKRLFNNQESKFTFKNKNNKK
ncbi:MAG: glycerol-3-phosphate 1-O-acyltransferase PlsY [Clostridia bacterium]|nr:glycerol-3-phosphate 1-O-acyltransferase PlsY [Clostridia bacterium]